MGALYRRKYTVLRHWLIQKSKTGIVRLKIAEERSDIDPGSIDPVVYLRAGQVGAFRSNQYDGEHLYPQRELPTTV